jgi:hypothetical protein
VHVPLDLFRHHGTENELTDRALRIAKYYELPESHDHKTSANFTPTKTFTTVDALYNDGLFHKLDSRMAKNIDYHVLLNLLSSIVYSKRPLSACVSLGELLGYKTM